MKTKISQLDNYPAIVPSSGTLTPLTKDIGLIVDGTTCPIGEPVEIKAGQTVHYYTKSIPLFVAEFDDGDDEAIATGK